MKILIDTREQIPFNFSRYGVQTETDALPVGDYSIPGFEDRVAIERKSNDREPQKTLAEVG
jgi:ERCC4-type nuclease